MATRLKWEIDDADCVSTAADFGKTGQEILELIDNDSLTVHFQPVFSAKNGKVYGYEALTRLKEGHPLTNISELFKTAILTHTISSLDVRCRENALREASVQGIKLKGQCLFINICPETLMDPAHRIGITDEFAEIWDIPKEKIILEITEESAIHNCQLFKKSIAYYRDRGYKIAIDDFGAGYGGLKMLSTIEPDFVKIDRHFISDIDRATVKSNLVDAIATACHRIGIKVIAEGIEREEELKVILNHGVELLQGYHLGKPAFLFCNDSTVIPLLDNKKANGCTTNGEHHFIGDIGRAVDTIHPSESISAAFNRFIKNPELRGLPVVVEDDRVVGMLHRNRFLENNILGKCGYGMHLNSQKDVTQLMERQFLLVEANTTLEEVAQRINSRKTEFLYDDICITKHGKYFGTVAISSLLDAMTEKSLVLARGANPLTGLPGNESIHRDIDKKLSQNMHFDVCYIDIDYFKPYNDHYGFERGDMVIKKLADILEDTITSFDTGSFNFAGHIGGDDFILITRPQVSISVCEKIISNFEAVLPELHGAEDYKKGAYASKNRKGEEETFSLLSLSIGIVSTEVYKIESYAQLASIATEVKKAAKMRNGSSIERDRRRMG